ncbi:M14 family zinc carboxypeptidase [Actinospongicola halichondriae]|uniref:M14 family zinc carboxypeptidase n=1 Tax=Actinospongicola halichondriae TaxID=3236844 RepID=UPI003D54AD44
MLSRRSTHRAVVAAGAAAAFCLALLPQADADGLLGLGDPTELDTFAPQLVTVTADLAQRNVIADSGLDVTEHVGQDYVEVVVHSPADLDLLESLGLPFHVRIDDLDRREAEVQEINRSYAATVATSGLPSGRTAYRTLEDYNAEMQALAAEHPGLVDLIELPHKSIEGKTILGLEIATDVTSTNDERPTFLLMGVHHAREWPSGEHTMEFAHDLVNGVAAGDERITGLLDQGRVVVIPVVNVDGFEKSVTDGMALDLRELNAIDPLEGTTSVLATPNNAYKRKNCRIHDGVDGVPLLCSLAPSPGGYGIGVDLNRNYGAFFGGPGADAEPVSPIYHGPSGFSEPETQNVRELVSQRHVTMLISNHTFSNLILRPNGVNPQTIGPDGLPIGDAPDEAALKALGADMAAQNGYANIHGWELYDTTGTTEDWSYNATGGFGYTFEIGANEFHPPFPEVVDEYLGAGEHAGRGNREAYLIALEAAVDPATHSIVAGTATPGATLRLSRTGSTPTWSGSFTDSVDTVLTVPADGTFEWHTNPSTRPLAKGKQYKVLSETPKFGETFTGMVPAPNESIDIAWSPTESADLASIDLDWALPDDLDLEVYRVENGQETQVASSGNSPGEKESTLLSPVTPGDYVFRIINFAAVPGQEFTLDVAAFDGSVETTTGLIEVWTLTCEIDGVAVEQVPVIVDRGQRTTVDLDVCGPDESTGGPSGPGDKPGKGKGRGSNKPKKG